MAGTALGDPIEIGSAAKVFGQGRHQDQRLVVGSLKANIGHLETAAGLAGLCKTLLVLQQEKAPPNAGLRGEMNPKVVEAMGDAPFDLPAADAALMDLRETSGKGPDDALVAGLSSFGYAG